MASERKRGRVDMSESSASSGKNRRDLLDKLVVQEARLSLANAQAIRNIKGDLEFVVICKRDSELCGIIKSANKAYQQQVEGKKKHGLGLPCYFACRALMLYLMEHGDVAHKEEIQKTLAELGTDIKKWRMAVHECYCKDAYAESDAKIVVVMNPMLTVTLAAMLEVMEKLGCEVKEGRAPRSNLERQTQGLLDALSKK